MSGRRKAVEIMSDHRLERPDEASVTEAGCASFEHTLALLDGLLEGAHRDEALRHAGDCPLCGPMVADWAPLSRSLVDAFEDAAEAAKPDLAALTDRVLARVAAPSAPPQEDGLVARFVAFARRAQPWMLLGATAAALALFLPALWQSPPAPAPVATVTPPVAEAPPPVVVVRDLDFGEDSNGMVYRTPRGGMTVIWVTENEGV